jgi:signal transduction histidine kinase
VTAHKTWTLRRRVTALCLAAGTVLTLLAMAAAFAASVNRTQVDSLANRAGPLRIDSERLLATLVDQETAVRGYALTGAPEDLGPYQDGQATERQLLADMRRLLAGEETLRAGLDGVAAQAAAWRRDVAEPVISAVLSGGPAAGRPHLSEAARTQFVGLRDSVGRLQDGIAEFRNSIADQAKRSTRVLTLLLVGAAIVVVVTGAALILLMNRLVMRPIAELASQVRRVSGGEYGHPIAGVGPPELARLAVDVDRMRRQIGHDLSEVRDARERVEAANAQLEAQTAELARSNRDLEQFAYVASHDLQEPLRKVASFCQLLQRRYGGKLDERADQYIAFAVDGAQRMQRLITDLLAFSRIGRTTAGFARVDLDTVMAQVADQVDATRQYTGGQITWADMPTVLGDEPLLATLLANLVGNALKFRRSDEPPKVHVSARRVADEWEITCRDNGIGVEPEFAEKIFVIFQRLHPKEAYPGTGMGLAIAKKIVEYHGGRIWVDPDFAEGTAIRFTVPVTAEAEQEAEPEAEPEASQTPDTIAKEAVS